MDERTAAFYTRNAGRLALDYRKAGSDYFATLDRAFEKAGKSSTSAAAPAATVSVFFVREKMSLVWTGTMVEKF
jgi:hypothetical protein